jgi:hypothetical protein
LLIIGTGRQVLGYLFAEGKIVRMDKKSPLEGFLNPWTQIQKPHLGGDDPGESGQLRF